jgi:hypothetical protein
MLFFSKARRFFSKSRRNPLAGSAEKHRARPALEALESRLTPYAVSSNVWPAPQLITISFEPDGTALGGTNVSNLVSTLGAKFGSAAAWQNVILKAAQSWAQQTNINFAIVNDSGAPIGSGNYEQGDPTMGDIRIGGYNFGNNTLAQAYLPPPVDNTSYAGDIEFNTGQSFVNGNVSGSYDLYTVALHEIGHALGLYHSASYGAAMYANYTTAKTGLAIDDINGIRSMYSGGAVRTADPFDAAAGNTTLAAAADLTSVLDPTNLNGVQNNLDITTAGMARYYRVTTPQGNGGALAQVTGGVTGALGLGDVAAPLTGSSGAQITGTLTLVVQSSGLSLLAPKVTVYASDGVTVLGTASAPGYNGGTVTLNVSGVTAGQVLYIKVEGCDKSAFGTGAFGLSMSFSSAAPPPVTAPNTMTANGPIPSNGGGQAITLNPQFQVDTGTTGLQTTSSTNAQSVAMDANGNYVVVWAAYAKVGTGWEVFGQRYTAAGALVGNVFQVNTYTNADQAYPSVAMAPNGAFVVTWSSKGQDGSGWGVYAQKYNPDGTPNGGEFQVNTYTQGDQIASAVAMDANGNFVITWSSKGENGSGWAIYAQRYSASGAAVGGEFLVSPAPATGDQKCSSVAMDSAGDFTIIWSGYNPATMDWGIYGQCYSAAGAAVGGVFQVNAHNSSDRLGAAIAMNGTTGDFVVTWSARNEDLNGVDVFVRRFNLQGVAYGAAFMVNTYAHGQHVSPSVAMDGNGNFFVVWANQDQASQNWAIFGQQYDASGNALGTQFRVSTITAGNQKYASVTMDSKGDAVAVWTNQIGNTTGVYGQRFLLVGGTGQTAAASTDAMEPPPDATTTGTDPNAAPPTDPTATATTTTTTTTTQPATTHGSGCTCPLCGRLASALGITSANTAGGYATAPADPNATDTTLVVVPVATTDPSAPDPTTLLSADPTAAV